MSKCVIDKISEKFSNIVIEFDDEESLVDYIKDFKEDIEDVLQLIKKALEQTNYSSNLAISLSYLISSGISFVLVSLFFSIPSGFSSFCFSDFSFCGFTC